MNTNTTALRVITLADGRRVKEVPEVGGCDGCMFFGGSRGCKEPGNADLRGCSLRNTIYQPADPEPVAVAEPVGYLWRHAGTGRTRLVEPDCVITTHPGGWEMVGPLVLGQAESVKREPLTDEQLAELMMKVWGCASIAPRHAPAFARAVERAHGIGGRDKGADHA